MGDEDGKERVGKEEEIRHTYQHSSLFEAMI